MLTSAQAEWIRGDMLKPLQGFEVHGPLRNRGFVAFGVQHIDSGTTHYVGGRDVTATEIAYELNSWAVATLGRPACEVAFQRIERSSPQPMPMSAR